jgi:hypothetical protein
MIEVRSNQWMSLRLDDITFFTINLDKGTSFIYLSILMKETSSPVHII